MSKPHYKLSLTIFVFVAALLMPAAALPHSTQSGAISIGHIWAYPAQPNTGQINGHAASGLTIDVFGPLLNGGNVPDAVTGVTSAAAQSANIVMWVRGSQFTRDFPLALPAGQPVALGPQTQFVRLYDVNKPYKAGDSFPITFHFQNVPDATIDVVVQGK